MSITSPQTQQTNWPILAYPKTRALGGRALGLCSWFALLTLIAVLVIINVALVGYDTISAAHDQFKFNTHGRRWYHAFIPTYKVEKNCDSVLYREGDGLRTNASLFEWRVESAFNDTGTTDLEYAQQALSGCSLRTFSAQVWMKDWKIATTSLVECMFGESAVMHMQTSTGLVLTRGTLRQFREGVATGANNKTKSPARVAVETAILLASVDVIQVNASWHPPQWNDPTKNLPVYFEAQFDFPSCPAENNSTCSGVIAKPAISDSSVIYNSGELYATPGSTLLDSVTSTFSPALSNLAQVMLSAIKLDIGDNRAGNIFLNPSVSNETLSTSFPMTDGTTPNLIAYLLDLNTTRSATYPSPPALSSEFGPSTIQSSYICRFYKLKPAGTLFALVLVVTCCMAAGVWMLYLWGLATFVYKDNSADEKCRCNQYPGPAPSLPLLPDRQRSPSKHGQRYAATRY